MSYVVNLSLLEFARLTVVPVLNRSVISGNTAVNLARSAALGTSEMLAGDISVFLTYRVRGRNSVIRQFVVFRNLSYERSRRLPIGELLT